MAPRLAAQQQTPIQVDNTLQSTSCQLGSGGVVTISLPTEALTGDNIPLRINLGGSSTSNCMTSISLTSSSNLQFVASGFPFQAVGNNTYQTVNPFPSNDNPLFSVQFKFPNFITCDGAMGTLNVMVEMDCDGEKTVCQMQLEVRARAGNYWTVEKEFISGNLACGTSLWRIYLRHNNPNPSNLGTYKIQGTLTENIGLPIISGAVHTVNQSMSANWHIERDVFIQNCAEEGQTITNAVDYDLVLGNDCERMEGSVTAQSPLMVSPNADISFTKHIVAGNNLSPGCQGEYYIRVENNGNVPWTNIVITDPLPPHVIAAGPPTLPAGWTWTLAGNVYTFSYGGNVLMPGQSTVPFDIRFPFTIAASATPGDIITNTAYITYQAEGSADDSPGSGGQSNSSCTGINCPQIDMTIQNDTASVPFEVELPRAIPSVRKCIIDPPNNSQPPLYIVGDVIRFRVNIGNSGSASLSTVLSDALGAPAQNLQIIPSSIQYAYYTDILEGHIYTCNYNGIAEPSIPFTITANTSDLQNPVFSITNMPGTCRLDSMNMLTITFEALILPQLYGNDKTNTAILNTSGQPSRQSSVKYSIDDIGYLDVNKRADQDVVENGQTFNYIIEVNNQGSVNIDNITLTDALPDCVQRVGDITVTNPLGNTVPYTVTGNVQIILSPSEALAPGATMTVVIPVQKVSGSSCCNITVSATAMSVTSGEPLSSFSGTEFEPAACVRSTECCDISGFDAQLVQRDGKFYVHLVGGAVPLQQVDITMLDFHVEYSFPDCKPADMGIFGQLSTTTNTVGGLILANGPMPAGNLSWELGAPSVVNGNTIEFEVCNPAVLDIPCCEFELTFCIKIRVKDVNCNVCEKTLCYTSEPTDPPCDLADLNILNPGRICVGQTIEFTWTGGGPSGGVDIYLVNAVNPNLYHLIATGVGNGSYSYTLPNDLPCDEVWHIVIKDPKSDCQLMSKRFTILCCEPRCDCGSWQTSDVRITQVILADSDNMQHRSNSELLKRLSSVNVGVIARCGEKTVLSKGSYVLTAPDFVCEPEECAPTYRWEIQRSSDSQIIVGTGKSFPYQFVQNGIYNIRIIPICGGKECAPCQIQVQVGRIIGVLDPSVVLPDIGGRF